METGLKLVLMLILLFAGYSYTKPRGQLPDYEAPVVLRESKTTVEDFCNQLHKSIMKEFK